MMVDLVKPKAESQLLLPGKIFDKRVVCGQREVVKVVDAGVRKSGE